MNNDLSSYFEDPEFKEALEKYEGMVKNHILMLTNWQTSPNIMLQKEDK